MMNAVKANVFNKPIQISLFGSITVMPRPQNGAPFVEAHWTFSLIPPKNLCRIQFESHKITQPGKNQISIDKKKNNGVKKFVLRKLEFNLIQSSVAIIYPNTDILLEKI